MIVDLYAYCDQSSLTTRLFTTATFRKSEKRHSTKVGTQNLKPCYYSRRYMLLETVNGLNQSLNVLD